MGRRAHPCPTMDSMTLGVIERACAEWRDHLRAIGRAESPQSHTTVDLNPHDDTRLKEAGRWRALIYS